MGRRMGHMLRKLSFLKLIKAGGVVPADDAACVVGEADEGFAIPEGLVAVWAVGACGRWRRVLNHDKPNGLVARAHYNAHRPTHAYLDRI